VLFNAAAARVLACPANEAIGDSNDRFIPQRFRSEFSAGVRGLDHSRTMSGNWGLWGLRATGEEFPMEASIAKVESAGKKFITAVIYDIRERMVGEQRLRESEVRFRLAAQAGKMFAYEWDAATDVIVRSPESVQILCIDEGTPLSGQQAMARVHPDDRERLVVAMAALSPEKPTLKLTYRIIRPDDTVIWVERQSRAHFNEQGGLRRIVGMVADITERRRAEQVLADMTRKLVEGQEQVRARIARVASR